MNHTLRLSSRCVIVLNDLVVIALYLSRWCLQAIHLSSQSVESKAHVSTDARSAALDVTCVAPLLSHLGTLASPLHLAG